MNTIKRGDVIEVPRRGTVERRVVAYTYDHPSGPMAATLPADLFMSGWWHLDLNQVRLASDQTVDWSGEPGAVRREAFEEFSERPPFVPSPPWKRLNGNMSIYEVLSVVFGIEAAQEFDDLCNMRISPRLAAYFWSTP